MTEDNLMTQNPALTFEEYQNFTHTTCVVRPEHLGDYLQAGLASEIGEYFGQMAKYHRGDRCLFDTQALMRKELGDIMWFVFEICNYYGWSAESIAKQNMDKLLKRKYAGTLKGDGDNR